MGGQGSDDNRGRGSVEPDAAVPEVARWLVAAEIIGPPLVARRT